MAQVTLETLYTLWKNVSDWVTGVANFSPKVTVVLPTKNAKEPFSGSQDTTHTFSTPMTGFCISNDGDQDLTFTIGTDTFTVKAGEVFSEDFEEFTEVTITTTVPFRAYGRG